MSLKCSRRCQARPLPLLYTTSPFNYNISQIGTTNVPFRFTKSTHIKNNCYCKIASATSYLLTFNLQAHATCQTPDQKNPRSHFEGSLSKTQKAEKFSFFFRTRFDSIKCDSAAGTRGFESSPSPTYAPPRPLFTGAVLVQGSS